MQKVLGLIVPSVPNEGEPGLSYQLAQMWGKREQEA